MATMPGLARVAHGAMAMLPAAVLAAPADPALELEALERLLALGKDSAFYLVLDADGPRLSLGLEGVVLRTYDARSVEVGRGRIAWVAAATPAAAGLVLTGGAWSRSLLRLVGSPHPQSGDPNIESTKLKIQSRPCSTKTLSSVYNGDQIVGLIQRLLLHQVLRRMNLVYVY
jgi:hypothetical protein